MYGESFWSLVLSHSWKKIRQRTLVWETIGARRPERPLELETCIIYSDVVTSKGTGKRGHIVDDTNVSPFARARNICCGHTFCVWDTKNVVDFVRNILCPQQMFPSLRTQRNVMSNNVSATMCPRLPVPWVWVNTGLSSVVWRSYKHKATKKPTCNW